MKIKKFGKTFIIKIWEGQQLNNLFACDTETEKIKNPSHIPKVVLTTAYDGGDFVYVIKNQDLQKFIDLHKASIEIYHNAAFDMSVITQETGVTWWDKIEGNKIHDTLLLYKLMCIATKGHTTKASLDFCADQLLHDVLPKDDSIRLTFGQYINTDGTIDYKSISNEHIIYAVLDPIATYLVYQKIQVIIKTLPTQTMLAHKIHLMGDVALADIHRNGVRVDLKYTKELRDTLTLEMKQQADILATYGWERGLPGIKKQYAQICDSFNIKVPTSPKANTYSMKAEDLEPYRKIPFVKALLCYLELEKKIAFLNEMTVERIHPRYDSLKNTARTGASKPNIQNMPRKGGIRECLIPNEGCVFCASDYSSIEMFTAANNMKRMFGKSKLYDVLNRGIDPHIHTAMGVYNTNAENITKAQRQRMKPANYGFLANMSYTTFVTYAQQYGLDLTLNESKKIKEGWANTYPEVKKFWKAPYRANKTYIAPTGFVRAHCTYTAWLNTHFQGQAAEGAKLALYFVLKAGLKMVMFIHDEIIIEAKKENAEKELKLLNNCMIKGMKMVCPMNIQVSGEIKERFTK